MTAPDASTAAIEDHLRSLLRAELPDPACELPPSTRVADLGISSLKVLRVIARLEQRHEIELEDDIVFAAETLGELAAAVARVIAHGTVGLRGTPASSTAHAAPGPLRSPQPSSCVASQALRRCGS